MSESIYRILMNKELNKASAGLSGRALDLASGHSPSYRKYLPEELEFTSADIKTGIDFNKPLPFGDKTFDTIFFINALYIAKNRMALFSEIRRVLKSGGKLVLASPFIANEMPAPDDFCRLTYQGLETELKAAGFKIKEIKRFGERFSSAVYLLDPFWYFRPVKFIVYGIAIFLDKLIPAKIKQLHPTPSGYVCLAEK
jgi:SAM-dependent methyltransferase